MAALGLLDPQQSQGVVSLDKLYFSEREGDVDDRLGEGEVEKMDDLELIARVTSHFPDKGQVYEVDPKV